MHNAGFTCFISDDNYGNHQSRWISPGLWPWELAKISCSCTLFPESPPCFIYKVLLALDGSVRHLHLTSYHQNTMTQNSKSLLDESFNPFAIHSFTNGSGLMPRPQLPPSHPVFIPSSHLRTYHPHAISPEAYPPSDSSSVASTDSNPSSRTSTPIHSPKVCPSSTVPPPRQIFVPFRKEAATPDLVLKKRLPTVVSRYK